MMLRRMGLFASAFLLACGAQDGEQECRNCIQSADRSKAPAVADVHDPFPARTPPGLRTGDPTPDLPKSPALIEYERQRARVAACGLDPDAGVTDRERGGVVDVTDPDAQRKLECLAARGDHQVIHHYVAELALTRPDFRPPQADELLYKWSMVSLRNYLDEVGINFDDDDFWAQYARLGQRPGWININSVHDPIYRYSNSARDLVEKGAVKPPKSEILKLRKIGEHDPF